MYLPTTTSFSVLVVPLLPPNKVDYFVCLSAVTPLPVTVWVVSLSIPHGMHLVVPTYPYFFWAVCHPSRTFPPIEPEQESHNRFFPSPHRQTIHSYLWPMTSPRLVLAGYMLVMPGPCACFTSMYVQSLPIAHSCRDLETCLHILPVILGFLWRGLFSDFIFSAPLLPLGLGFAGLWASLSLTYPFILSVALPLFPVISPCYSCCDVIWSKPVGPIWACYLWLSIVIWAFSVLLLAGSYVSFVFF